MVNYIKNSEREIDGYRERDRFLVGQFFESSPAVFSQFRCALLNPEPLCLKSPSASLSMAYTRLFKYWSGISHYSSTACKCSLPPFTLRRPVSALNDSLFPNSSWFMMSNPKIPSKTLFLLSCSRATSFRRCLPSFTLTGTRRVCLPDANGTDGGWRARRSLNHNVKKRRQKRRGRCHDLWPSFSPPPPLHFPAFMLMASAAREHSEWHTV